MTGCERTSAEQTAEQAIVAADVRETGYVLDSQNSMPTPADRLAKSLAESCEFKTAVDKRDADLETLATEAENKNIVAADQIITARQISDYDSNIIDRAGINSTIAYFDVKRADEELAKIEDPETRQIAKDHTNAQVTSNLINSVRFDHIEPDDARKILEELTPGYPDDINDLLERLDAGENVIHNYYVPSRHTICLKAE